MRMRMVFFILCPLLGNFLYNTERETLGCQTIRRSDDQTSDIRLSDCQTVRLSDCQTIRLSDCQTIRLSDYQTVRLSDCQTIRLSDVCLAFASDARLLLSAENVSALRVAPRDQSTDNQAIFPLRINFESIRRISSKICNTGRVSSEFK